MAYREASHNQYRKLMKEEKKWLGRCFEGMTKITFPSENNEYTCFRPIEEDPNSQTEYSSSGDDRSVILLWKTLRLGIMKNDISGY